MARKAIIALRVTPEEKAKAEQLAAEYGMTVSAYLRRCIKVQPMPKIRAA